jgi:hypothetical protein
MSLENNDTSAPSLSFTTHSNCVGPYDDPKLKTSIITCQQMYDGLPSLIQFHKY